MFRILRLAVCVLTLCACTETIEPQIDGGGSRTLGASCSMDPQCQSEFCLAVGSGRGVCTDRCSGPGQCPSGWSCGDVGVRLDNYCICEVSPEVCDGEDNDCDVFIDEDCTGGEDRDAGVPAMFDAGPVCPCDEGDIQSQSDVCEGGERRRTRTCDAMCTWSPWSRWSECEEPTGMCTAGEEERQEAVCGCGGTRGRVRSCGSDERWTDFSAWGDCDGGACTVPTNVPAPIVDVSEAPSGMAPASFSLTTNSFDGPSPSHFQEMAITVVNASDVVRCQPRARVILRGAGGVMLAEAMLFVDGPPYQGLFSDLPCLGPGETGAAWTIEEVPSPVDPAAVTRVEIAFEAEAQPDRMPSPDAPAIVSLSPSGPDVTGRVEARSGTSSITISVYETVNGYVLDRYTTTVDGPLSAGEGASFSVRRDHIDVTGPRDLLAFVRWRAL